MLAYPGVNFPLERANADQSFKLNDAEALNLVAARTPMALEPRRSTCLYIYVVQPSEAKSTIQNFDEENGNFKTTARAILTVDPSSFFDHPHRKSSARIPLASRIFIIHVFCIQSHLYLAWDHTN